MRSMMFRSDPVSLFEELMQPYKGMQRLATQRALDSGTVDKPAIITRGEWVERKYKAWQEADGSYHEELIDDDDSPIGKEGTD